VLTKQGGPESRKGPLDAAATPPADTRSASGATLFFTPDFHSPPLGGSPTSGPNKEEAAAAAAGTTPDRGKKEGQFAENET